MVLLRQIEEEARARSEYCVIRGYENQDKTAVEAICLATAPAILVATQQMQEQTLLLYSHHYTHFAQTHCFVATNEAMEVVGYVLCAPDYKQYKSSFLAHEQKQLRQLSRRSAVLGRGEVGAQKPYAKRYPAHLHIDLLPAYQHVGLGTKLMDALVEHLGTLHVPGVMLIVGKGNTNAIAFYKKYGFKKLGDLGGIVFGLEI